MRAAVHRDFGIESLTKAIFIRCGVVYGSHRRTTKRLPRWNTGHFSHFYTGKIKHQQIRLKKWNSFSVLVFGWILKTKSDGTFLHLFASDKWRKRVRTYSIASLGSLGPSVQLLYNGVWSLRVCVSEHSLRSVLIAKPWLPQRQDGCSPASSYRPWLSSPPEKRGRMRYRLPMLRTK